MIHGIPFQKKKNDMYIYIVWVILLFLTNSNSLRLLLIHSTVAPPTLVLCSNCAMTMSVHHCCNSCKHTFTCIWDDDDGIK